MFSQDANEASGMVILYMVSFDSNIDKKRVLWESSVYKTLKKRKPNIVGGKKYTHYGSTGTIIHLATEDIIKRLMIVQ